MVGFGVVVVLAVGSGWCGGGGQVFRLCTTFAVGSYVHGIVSESPQVVRFKNKEALVIFGWRIKMAHWSVTNSSRG